ncbi:hypothetical protein C0995_014144 [Termitomyces sp. Mi166|nr:hypothetical protein C0995_014144 [Termitomyces sp. Mi166\
MVTSKDSPKRRKSIAATSQNKPAVLPRARRRPHSIVSGDRLSPFAKARRSLVPRKSILKTFTNILHNDHDASNSESQIEPGSQPPYPSSSLDDTTNQSMDITRNLDNRTQDNTMRKSFGGRRVSFAKSVHVRFIQNLKKDKNANDSVGKIQPSPTSEQSDRSTRPPTNENDYPGAASNSRRRSSTRYSLSEDMDITSIGPQVFLSKDNSAIVDEELDFDDDEDHMDMTEVVRGELIRKRSLSMGQRAPLAQLPQKQREQDALPSDDMEQYQSFEESDSQALSDDIDHSGPMDFTMPLSRSQRPPAEQDAVWHALRKATHSGDTPIEPELSSDDSAQGNTTYEDDGMDLDDAVQRLMRARASLPSVLAMTTPVEAETAYDDSFSTEGSFEGQQEQTMNLSTVYGRPSTGGNDGRQSMGSAMDESEVYGAIALPLQSTPRRSLIQQEEELQQQIKILPLPKEQAPPVFQPPPSTSSSASAGPSRQQLTLPVFTPPAPTTPSKVKTPTSGPLSPAKAKKSPGRGSFTAAFAPPVARASPNKRLRSADDERELGRSSPVKRASLTGKWSADTLSVPSPKPQPRPFSPSKKAPFQNSTVSTSSQRPSSSIRRPSGYFAKRKSLGVDSESRALFQEDETPVVNASPKKVVGFERASLDSVSVDARQHFDQDQEPGHCNREISRQAAASPTITRESPAPTSRPTSAVVDVVPVSPKRQIDASAVLSPDEPEPDNADDPMDLDATEQWRNAVENSEFNEIEDLPISIQQFFAMTGIKFMDELTAPRRSMHPSQQAVLQPREPEAIPLAEYVVAMGMDIPQLALYSRVSKDLEAWIEKSKADFLQAEDEAAKITPELFTEYSKADEEGQAELLHQLQLIRTNTRALARSDWYDWKLQWLEGLRIIADQTFRSLETVRDTKSLCSSALLKLSKDAKTLEAIRASAGDLIPALRLEYEEIRKEHERESAEVKEIEACDQDYLNELKASIAEQNIEVEALRAEVAESKAKLLSLQERLRETDTEKQETRAVINEAQRVLHLQKNGTRAEVFRLKDELESLEDLHMFRVTQVNADMFEYVYASQFRVTIPCKSYAPMTARVNVERLDRAKSGFKDNFPRLTDFLLRMAKEEIVQGGKRTARQIIHRLSDYWSSCAQLRAQLKLLLIKFPVDIEIIQSSQTESPGFKAKVMVVFPSVKAKAFISFVFVGKAFSYWPVAINSLQIEVEVAYGQVDREMIGKAVVDRLSQATPEDNYACLLDACIEAQEIYY